MITINAVVVAGYQIASGQAKENPFNQSTIALQKPIFKRLGLNLDNMFNGTINAKCEQFKRVEIAKPDVLFNKVKWIEGFAAENFAFLAIELVVHDTCYKGYIYQPIKESKISHVQPDNVIELLAPIIPNLNYQDNIIINAPSECLTLEANIN